MGEIWKDIAGYEGIYQVSSSGRVKSLHWRNTDKERVLTTKINKSGYLWVILYKSGVQKCMLIHRLVAMAFLPTKHGCDYVNHKDENTMNNCADNLEWCTPSYNVRYSIKRHPERSRKCKQRNRPSGIPYKHKSKVIQYDLNWKIIAEWANIACACNENKWRTSSVLECCNGKRKTAYGFYWRFANEDKC